MKIRIGIDVGGTFTDAVLMDNETYKILAQVKIPTTHKAAEGVTKGIIKALHKVLSESHCKAEQVSFIAHGTTQATNALLEGDVATVGIISVGQGIEGLKTKADTKIGEIPLTDKKNISTNSRYIELKDGEVSEQLIKNTIRELIDGGCESIVASEAFSVDNPENEQKIMQLCSDMKIPSTASNEVSKLYGLKIRTRTAVVNASIMPKMIATAESTVNSIEQANITSPLMVMRCDGGVMSVDEMRKRPILTILSGPAAGVAGALMYEKLTDGLFFEVGGTSTDISCIKDGKVMLKYAEIGGHKTYLNSLDVRTVGIGGGSMIAWENGKIVGVGPRSAHIADLDYECYTEPQNLEGARLKTLQPRKGDPEYLYLECENGQRFALTLAGAANVSGCVPEDDYARGNLEAAKSAWALVGGQLGITANEAAEIAMDFATKKNQVVAQALMKEYGMESRTTVFVGGGGGASTVVPHLANTCGVKYKIAENAPIISTIGVALAMVRDMVERTVSNPNEEDIISIRREVEQKAIRNGADPDSIEIEVQVDSQKNLLRAIAVGVTELRSKDMMNRTKTQSEIISIASTNLQVDSSEINIVAKTENYYIIQTKEIQKRLFGLFRKIKHPLRVIDNEGIIRLQRPDALVTAMNKSDWENALQSVLSELTIYNDGGANYPSIWIVCGNKIIDLSGLMDEEQIIALARVEMAKYQDDDSIAIVGSYRL